MDKRDEATLIEDNISKYLAVQFPCPKCNNIAGITLHMLYTNQWCYCPECKTKMNVGIAGQELLNFVQSFDALYEQLHKIGLHLFFLHEQLPKIWSKGDKP